MATGYLENNEPFIDLQIRGMVPSPAPTKLLIDTGFTGFLSIPLVKALPLGLVLVSTTSVVLADGSTVFRLLCLATVNIDGQQQAGTVILEPTGSSALLGMDFLRRFNLQLNVQPNSGLVELVPVPLPPTPPTP